MLAFVYKSTLASYVFLVVDWVTGARHAHTLSSLRHRPQKNPICPATSKKLTIRHLILLLCPRLKPRLEVPWRTGTLMLPSDRGWWFHEKRVIAEGLSEIA